MQKYLNKKSFKILKLLKKKPKLSNKEISLLLNSTWKDVSGYTFHLLNEGYIEKYYFIPSDEKRTSTINQKFIVSVKGIEYLESIPHYKWRAFRNSYLFPVLVALTVSVIVNLLWPR